MSSIARRAFLKKSSQAGIVSLVAWSSPERIFKMIRNDDEQPHEIKNRTEQLIALGEKKFLKSDYGPVAFGWVLSANIVSWSGKDSKDLLIGRFWDGLYLYPSNNLDDSDFNAEPVKVCESVVVPTFGFPADWNKDGQDELIVTDRRGFLYFFSRKGSYPEITFKKMEELTDKKQAIKFNIPYDNPNNISIEDLGGYDDPLFSNYLYPVGYPDKKNRINLIIGDSAGNLWWLPDKSDGKRKPEYHGVKYFKPNEDIKTQYGRDLIKLYGNEFVKPAEKICDEYGEPFLLGEGIEVGSVFKGGNTRPVLYRNDVTGSPDLLVLGGMKKNQLYYLSRSSKSSNRKPVFRNLGEIKVDWSGSGINDITGYHSKLIIYSNDGWNDIMVTLDNHIAVLKNKKLNTVKPEFIFDRWISGRNVAATGYNFTEILSDVQGKKYLLDNPNELQLREIKTIDGEVKLSSEKTDIQDQSGIFRPEGETDPQGGKDWGFHRAYRWNFDGSGRQHLIVGSDKGLLYLLIEEEKLGTNGEFRYRSVGPLKDTGGNIIKIHNRACAAGIDLDGDGTEDLVVGGVTYQLGFRTDPNPGGGFYYLLNKGLDEEGIPKLEKAKPLIIKGHEFDIYTNSHVHLKVVRLFGGESKQIVLATQRDGFKARIFKPVAGELSLQYTGIMIERLSIQDNLLDIDGDGRVELVFGGGETGVAYYHKLNFNAD